ncbi:hypothetical protein [Methylobacterium sp. Leaf118]|uniref:hypothetical protein n=1 Tax=Methylobacterium sp. Leaf118 TaxID=2876562 RepID=UPI001E433B29|nr:hypothetical protein [Methylobacterium sp. Leaf118]
MADDALSYLVEAFGHVSEAEIQAFLDTAPSTPRLRVVHFADAPLAFETLAALGLPAMSTAEPDQTIRA